MTLRAEHPEADMEIPGPVSAEHGIASLDGSSLVGQVLAASVLPADDEDPMIIRFQFADAYAGRVQLTITTRNLCGPTEFAVDLDVAANGSISVET